MSDTVRCMAWCGDAICLGTALQADSITTRVERAHGFSACNYIIANRFQRLLCISTCAVTPGFQEGVRARERGDRVDDRSVPHGALGTAQHPARAAHTGAGAGAGRARRRRQAGGESKTTTRPLNLLLLLLFLLESV